MVKIFNLFITYGDTFLPNPTTYDELYYELIRMHKVFEDVHSMGERAECSAVCVHVLPAENTLAHDMIVPYSIGLVTALSSPQPSGTAPQMPTVITSLLPAS